MELQSPQKEIYSKERFSALQAQRLAQEIAAGPVVFQVSRLMVKLGIFQMLDDNKGGLTLEEIAEKAQLSRYGAQCLLESSLTIGTVLLKEDKFRLAKAGWFLLHEDMARVNMDFNHDVNYLGLFHLEEAIKNGKPEGLKVFGEWPTIYEGLSQLPEQVQKSWFGFDHYYSDCSFDEAMEIVFDGKRRSLLDVGGNTGRFAMKCVTRNAEAEVTIMDLPQQLEMMRAQTKGKPGADRIHGHGANLLDEKVPFPTGFDAIWMSQFLDCFSLHQVTKILKKVYEAANENTNVWVLEPLWDQQKFEASSYALQGTSLYFTCIANGNSKMYRFQELVDAIEEAGFKLDVAHHNLGSNAYSLLCFKKIKK